MSKIIKITAFFLFFVMCFCVRNALAQDLSGTCPYTHKWCCWNGEMTCVDKSSSAADYCTDFCGDSLERVDDLTDLPTLDGGILKPIETCTKGATQTKYTASGCTYTTQTRECCGLTWSGWDEECCSGADCCTSSQCWNGSSCVSKGVTSRECSDAFENAISGTQTRIATCNNGTGWIYTNWIGTCTCETGYDWSTSGCVKQYQPVVCSISSCPSGQHLVNAGTEDCCCEYDNCGVLIIGGNTGPCRCLRKEIDYRL